MDYPFIITGFLVGTLVGVTGMGGGALLTPLLVLMLGVKPTLAVGSDLMYAAITKIVGGAIHFQHKTVDLRFSHRLALGSVPASLAGVYTIHRLRQIYGEGIEHFVVRMLGIMLVTVAIVLLLKSHPKFQNGIDWLIARLRRKPVGKSETEELSVPTSLTFTILSGAVLGFLVGFTSIGSGTLFGVLMLMVYRMSAKQMIGTDIYHAALLTSAAAAGHFFAGNVDIPMVGNLLIGSIPGVIIGSRITQKLPNAALRPILACVLLISGIKML